MKSIRTKLIVYFSIVILVSTSILGFFTLNRTSKTLIDQVEETIIDLTKEGVKVTESRVGAQRQALEIIAGMLDIQSMDWERQQPALQRQAQRTAFWKLE